MYGISRAVKKNYFNLNSKKIFELIFSMIFNDHFFAVAKCLLLKSHCTQNNIIIQWDSCICDMTCYLKQKCKFKLHN